MATPLPAIRISKSDAWFNKENLLGHDGAYVAFENWQPSLEDAISHILAGGAVMAGEFNGTRSNENFQCAQLVFVDFDANISVAGCLAIPFIRRYAAAVYPSASSRKVTPKNPNGDYRTRVVFVLSEPVEGAERYRIVAHGVCDYLGATMDEASYKPAQPWFGSTNRVEEPYINLDTVLPLALAGALTADLAAADYAQEQRHAELLARRSIMVIDQASAGRREKYAAAAMNGDLVQLANAPTGTRNNTIFDVALSLFSKALSGDWPGIDVPTAQRELEAIVSAWPNVKKSLGTIERARKAAKPKPLVLPNDAPAPRQKPAQDAPAPAVEAFTAWGQGSLPDALRSAILTAFAPAAPIIEMLNEAQRAGLLDVSAFTAKDASAANERLQFGISTPTLYRALENCEFFSKCPYIEGMYRQSEKNSTGRRSAVYCMMPVPEARAFLLRCARPRLTELHNPATGKHAVVPVFTPDMVQDIDTGASAAAADELNDLLQPVFEAQQHVEKDNRQRADRDYARLQRGIDDPYSTPMPAGWPLNNAANYRAAFIRATQAENPQRSRNDIRRLAGLSVHSVKRAFARAGLQSEQQEPITQAIRNPREIGQEVSRFSRMHKTFPTHITLRTAGRVVDQVYKAETIHEVLAEAEREGAEITVRHRTANIQRVVSDTPPPMKRPATGRIARTPRDAEMHSRRDTPPDEYQYQGAHHNPAWLRAVLWLVIDRLKWRRYFDGRYIGPHGELIDPDTSAADLMHLIRASKNIPTPIDEGMAGLLQVAAELGAVIRRVEVSHG